MRDNRDQDYAEEFTYDADQGGSDFIDSLPTPEIVTTQDLIAAATPVVEAPKPTDAMLRGKEISQIQFDGMTPVYQSSGGSMREGQPGELLGYRFENSQIQEPGMVASYSAPVYRDTRGGQTLVDPGGKFLGYSYLPENGIIKVPKPEAILAYEQQFGTTMEPIYSTRTRDTRGGQTQVEYGPPIGYRFDNGKSQYVNFDASGTYQNTQNRGDGGAFVNIALSIISVAYPPAAPFIQAYNAVKALDSGDTLGFILNAAGASVKLPGLDASTTKLLKDVSTGAKIIKAVESGDPLKIASSMVNLPGVDPALKDLSIVVNTAKAINDGNISGAFNGIVKMSDRDSIGRLTDRFDDIVSSSGGGDAATIDNTESDSGGPTPEEQAAQEQEDREQAAREAARASEKTIEDQLTDSGLVSTDSSVDTLAQEQADREQAARDAIRDQEQAIQLAQEQEDREQAARDAVRASEKTIEDKLVDSGLISKTDDEKKLAPVTVTTKALQEDDLDITGNTTVGTPLTTTDVAALTTKDLGALNPVTIRETRDVAALTTKDLDALDTVTIPGTRDVAALDTVTIRGTRDVAALTTKDLGALDPVTIRGTRDVAALTTKDLGALDPVTIRGTRDVAALTTKDLDALDPVTIRGTRDVAALTTKDLDALDPVTIRGTRDVAALTTKDLDALDPVTIRGTRDVAALTTKDVAALTTQGVITLPKLTGGTTKTITTGTPTTTPVAPAAVAADAYVDKLVKAGTGFDPSAEFDPYWFSKYQKSQKATKIASGGYLDDLLANPTSFEELLQTLRN